MLLGNLSAAKEHEARKKKTKKKKSTKTKTDDDAERTTPIDLRRLPKASAHSIQFKMGDEIPVSVLIDFLTVCPMMLMDEGNIDEMIEEAYRDKVGLNHVAVNFQRDVMEHNFRMERNYGCQYLSMLPKKYPNEKTLLKLAQDFVLATMTSYYRAVHRRYERYNDPEDSLKPPSPSTPMSKATLLEFMEYISAMYTLSESREELRLLYERTNEPPNDRVVEKQREAFKLFGYEADFGVQCLNQIQRNYPNDREIMGKFQGFASSAEFAVHEATMTAAQREEYYAEIPPLMVHFPHIYMLQQRSLLQREQLQKQQQAAAAAAAGGGGASKTPGRLDADALRASGMLSFLTSADGRKQLQDLSERVRTSRSRLEPLVKDWTVDRKREYFDHFAEHPIVQTMTEKGDDPAGKMKAIISMPDSEIDQLMTLLIVIGQEDSESEFIKSLTQQAQDAAKSEGEGGGDSSGKPSKAAVMNALISTMGSLSSFGKPANPGMAHDHNHNHGHGHSHDHGGGGCCGPVHKAAPDISTGKGESMDR